jgi:aspartyl-tRNA(Asn)/glutamyl-tRNA(Gln) amidotransferase subunit A
MAMTSAADTRFLSIREAGALLRQRSITSSELTRACLDLISSIDGELHSFILVTADHAMEQAAEADKELAAGTDRGPLHGIPIGLKDLFATRDIATTAHSKVLLDWKPDEDSAVTESFSNAGAVLLGKLAMHEFAAGKPGDDLPFPPARNPWNLEHIPGGSSSGSGAALAAGLCFGAMGSDTGGSIRGPAAFCGIAGIKPTFGRISRRGVVPLSWTFDHAGPMARSVEDCALLLQAISGYDSRDPSSANVPVPDFTSDLGRGIQGLRLGVPREWLAEGDGCEPEVIAAFEGALATLQKLGAVLVDVPSAAFIDSQAANLLVGLTEAYSYHRDNLRTRPGEFSKNLRNQFLEGAFIGGADYVHGQRATAAIRNAITSILDGVDAIVSPTAATIADRFDAPDPDPPIRRPAFMSPANVTGFPAISVPCGMSSGLPIGLQFMGRAFDEVLVLRVAQAYEAATDWHKMHPAI